MSTSAFFLVLSAALLHATWNAILKASGDRLVGSWAIVAGAMVTSIPLLVAVGLPSRAVWGNVVVSSAIHLAYNLSLPVAYERADLSVAYPIARGTAPLIVTLVGTVFLGDPATLVGVAGVVLISVSLIVIASGHPIRNVSWALLTGLTIAGYTINDGIGVRANGDSVQYISLVFLIVGLAMSGIVAARRGIPAMVDATRTQPFRLLAGGAASAGAYLLVMIAARTEPLGLVAGLRETSALIGLAIGVVILGERIRPRHAGAVALAVTGAFLIATT